MALLSRHSENTCVLFLQPIFTGRNEVWAKVIFSQACVILFTGGCLLQIFGGVCSKFSGGCLLQIFGGGGFQFLEYGQRLAGTHPSGMHSCLINLCIGLGLSQYTKLCAYRLVASVTATFCFEPSSFFFQNFSQIQRHLLQQSRSREDV